ncbi:hypothetical protein [Pseudomonas guariconensis]|uniref:hypothetical protein n=1 Tax=Pseudomonas guariconensis TaxID=1288410 RepID=UPI0011AF349B|nr:hypothetical protein [Pseudomonas guariconensis]MBH3361335.1 hypothetical protein [Pseudomonas guariconensis]
MIFDCDKNHAGPIYKGVRRADVRKVLGAYKEFKKSPFSSNTADDFQSVGVHVFYNSEDVVRGVEIFKGARVFVCGLDVFSFSLTGLVAELERIGVGCVYDEAGANITDLGIGFYSPDVGEVETPSIEGVYVEFV